MKVALILLLLASLPAEARMLFSYGLNYSSEKDSSTDGDYEKTRTFHKVFLGAAINSKQTLFFGWNVNSWSSSISQGTADEDTYSMLEMGPKVQWFFSEEYTWYMDAEWNPYARGDRDKIGTAREISGSSLGIGLGYRYRLSRMVGLGASIHYHSLSVDEEKVDSTENEISDKVSNIMPMLELTFITR